MGVEPVRVRGVAGAPPCALSCRVYTVLGDALVLPGLFIIFPGLFI